VFEWSDETDEMKVSQIARNLLASA